MLVTKGRIILTNKVKGGFYCIGGGGGGRERKEELKLESVFCLHL